MCKIIAIAKSKAGRKDYHNKQFRIGPSQSRARGVLLIDADAQGSLTASLGFYRAGQAGGNTCDCDGKYHQ